MALTLSADDVETAHTMVGEAMKLAQKQEWGSPMKAALAFRAMVNDRPELAEAVVVSSASVLLPQVRMAARKHVKAAR